VAQSVYYDSCIFLNAQNQTHAEHQSCLAITTPSSISWVVWLCLDLISSETTAGELVSAFEVNCALEGKLVVHAHLAAARTLAAKYKNDKIRLKKLQLKDQDFTHLMCAVSVKAEALTTVDPDFWDAANKRNPSAARRLVGTKRLIEATFPIKVLLPSQLRPA
jgi:hypothetical protein